MYVLYETSTGKAVSQTELPVDNLPVHLSVKQTDKVGIWNETTLDFDPFPKTSVITKLEFLDRFTDAELAAILDEAKTNTLVEVFIKKLDLADSVDLNNTSTVTGVHAVSSLGLISTARVEEILNG